MDLIKTCSNLFMYLFPANSINFHSGLQTLMKVDILQGSVRNASGKAMYKIAEEIQLIEYQLQLACKLFVELTFFYSFCSTNRSRSTQEIILSIKYLHSRNLLRYQKIANPAARIIKVHTQIQENSNFWEVQNCPLKMASQETIPSFYECLPLLGVFCV